MYHLTAKGAAPTDKYLVVDVDGKGEGGIHVFFPVFVIGGTLVVDVDNTGWT